MTLSATPPAPDQPSAAIPTVPDLRLVVTDMDGTLLGEDRDIPADFWPVLDELGRRGILFAPASGRQFATLERQFARYDGPMAYLAENGTLVVSEGEVIASTPVEPQFVTDVVTAVREAGPEHDLGVVVCGVRSAYIERCDDPFLEQVVAYYAKLEIVDDVLAPQDDILKIAVYDFNGSEQGASVLLDRFRADHQVVVSGQHWVDLMSASANKGAGLRLLQERLGIGREQTVVFGDYLNDLELYAETDWGFAVANAHPDVLAAAPYRAPSNAEQGVVQVLSQLLGS